MGSRYHNDALIKLCTNFAHQTVSLPEEMVLFHQRGAVHQRLFYGTTASGNDVPDPILEEGPVTLKGEDAQPMQMRRCIFSHRLSRVRMK